MRRAIGTSGVVCFIVAVSAACGTDDAAGGSLDSVSPAATTPISAPPTLPPETVTATLESIPPETSNPRATVPISVADSVPPTLDLSGVTPASIPMAISEHLNSVQQAVQTDVGDDIFAGSAFTNDANDEMTIYGTDPAAIAAALDRVDTPLRDRITVAETRYSLNEIETYAEQARARLDAAGIAAMAGVQFGVDAVAVQLVTPDGQPDANLEVQATSVLGDIPAIISFSGPIVLA